MAEHWKEDGSIQCVSGVGGQSLRLSTTMDGIIIVRIEPYTHEDIDGIPLHKVEIDLFVLPKK